MAGSLHHSLGLDAPLGRGLQMRWQRKLNDSSLISRGNDSILSCSYNTSFGSKTPRKSFNASGTKTPKTSNKTPAKLTGKGRLDCNGPRTPKTPSSQGDRFIPNRSGTQFELGHHLLTSSNHLTDEEQSETASPSQKDYQSLMNAYLNGDRKDDKIMSYQNRTPVTSLSQEHGLRVLYSQTKVPGPKRTKRQIPQVPERILDAPEILDDYYLNLLDWSSQNLLAVCLGGRVYMWNAQTGEIQQLFEMEGQHEYVSSVAWIKEGNYLGVGTSNGDVQLWDVNQQKRLRNMTGQYARVGSLSWNDFIISSGSRSGNIHHHDVRVAQHLVCNIAAHTEEVCGLKWSPDGRSLASGSNDNLLKIWPAATGMSYSERTPLHTLTLHKAAVKAVAWCPWQPNIIASGGGTADRHIRFWNSNTGACINSIDTKSQVCSLLWSEEHREIVSGHGFAQNQLIVWKYPSMTKLAELTGHSARVLHMALSPDHTTVVSAAADETLRLWKCFESEKTPRKSKLKQELFTSESLGQSIR